jgi:alkanesulfonate monooxygenase SsuD/methylene tetrahydromethanopterin reductase-like flavin-dependent oxidoreductase (luciferase family)
MRFGLMYPIQHPHPDAGSEQRTIKNCIEQVKLADSLGYDAVWATEHHFLDEYSLSSAPEIFLTACAAQTRNIKIGHGIVATPPNYNHPFRVAERLAMLDIVSDGRVQFGFGETTSDLELKGFGIERACKREMADTTVPLIIQMMTQTPFAGAKTPFLELPQRNVTPKPVQRPHPPLWQAAVNRDTIRRVARKGAGVLLNAFVDAAEAKYWVDEYYRVLEEECVPVGLAVNPAINAVVGFMCCRTEEEAISTGLEGTYFFLYSNIYHYALGGHQPGMTCVWDRFQSDREAMGMIRLDGAGAGAGASAGVSVPTSETLSAAERTAEKAAGLDEGQLEALRGGVGTPDQLRERFLRYEEIGIDSMMFMAQGGETRHEDICASLELFAKEVMPEFTARDEKFRRDKEQRLAPMIEKVMARREPWPEPDPDYRLQLEGQQYSS